MSARLCNACCRREQIRASMKTNMKTHALLSQPFLLGAMIICHLGTWSAPAQSNIVVNGSFEMGDTGWSWNNEPIMNTNRGAAEGTNHVIVRNQIWQDLNTGPRRDYVLSFAYYPGDGPGMASVSWGDAVVQGLTNLATSGATWRYVYCYLTATNTVTRLLFQATSQQYNLRFRLDDVKVGWLYEPLRLDAQPQDVTGLEGGTAAFSVTANGAPPLSYQWLFTNQPIVGATTRALTLVQLVAWQAGPYKVVVSNISGVVTSATAQLQIDPPATTPVILSQPAGSTLAVGYGCSLTVVAVGEAPLAYQWLRNATNVSAATNATLLLNAVAATDAGAYTVLVSNHRGSALSLPATVTVTNTTGGGYILVDTYTNNAPAYDVDGTTRLTGANFSAQVYAGADATVLRPVGAKVTFGNGYLVNVVRSIPDVPATQTAYVQLRAWEAARGATYEEGRARGGKFGVSPIASVIATNSTKGARVLLQSFKLQAGLPFFFTGRLASAGHQPDGTWQLILTGAPGFRYLIEHLSPPNNWTPFVVVTNVTGTVTFQEDGPVQHPVRFYRARMLD